MILEVYKQKNRKHDRRRSGASFPIESRLSRIEGSELYKVVTVYERLDGARALSERRFSRIKDARQWARQSLLSVRGD